MAVAQVTPKDVDALLRSGKLSVSGTHRWRHGEHKSWAKIDIPVQIADEKIKDVALRIVVSASLADTEKRDFALLWNNVPVRRLCFAGSHTNRHTNTERWLRATHKHTWTDHCMDRFAYTPTDITSEDVQGQLAQFCSESGIAYSGTITDIPAIQGDSFHDM